jgi:hypothetical protein
VVLYPKNEPEELTMLYEIRNYWFDPTLFEEYKKWSRELAFPYIKEKMDVVGFWFKNDMPPEHDGSLPWYEGVVPSNVTWVIRWQDREHRDKAWEELGTVEWERIFSMVPGGSKSYLREEVKFAESL